MTKSLGAALLVLALEVVGVKRFVEVPSPYDTRLTGHTEQTSLGNNKTTWQWTFKADVPGA